MILIYGMFLLIMDTENAYDSLVMYLPFERSVVVVRALMLLQRFFAIVLFRTTFKGTLEKHFTTDLCYVDNRFRFLLFK